MRLSHSIKRLLTYLLTDGITGAITLSQESGSGRKRKVESQMLAWVSVLTLSSPLKPVLLIVNGSLPEKLKEEKPMP